MLVLPGILLVTSSSPFFISPRTGMTTGIVSVFISHILLISISRSLYLDNFSVNFAEVFLSDETVVSMNMHLLFFFSLTAMSGLSLLLLSLLLLLCRTKHRVFP